MFESSPPRPTTFLRVLENRRSRAKSAAASSHSARRNIVVTAADRYTPPPRRTTAWTVRTASARRADNERSPNFEDLTWSSLCRKMFSC